MKPITVKFAKEGNTQPNKKLPGAAGTDEEWRDIVGYEGFYQVSNYGRVKSLDAHFNHVYGKRLRIGKRKKISFSDSGYCTVNLFTNNKIKIHKCHRLVAQAFIPNPENKRVVNHIDGNKTNNHVSNLEWVTHSENTRHAEKNKLTKHAVGEDVGCSILSNLDAVEIKILSAEGVRHRTLAKVFGVSENNISLIVNGRKWKQVMEDAYDPKQQLRIPR